MAKSIEDTAKVERLHVDDGLRRVSISASWIREEVTTETVDGVEMETDRVTIAGPVYTKKPVIVPLDENGDMDQDEAIKAITKAKEGLLHELKKSEIELKNKALAETLIADNFDASDIM